MDVSTLIQQLGPTGAILAVLIYFARALSPLVAAAVGHLGRIADAMQQTALQVQALDTKIDRVQAQLAEAAEDTAGIYALMVKERPSRRRQFATGGD